MNNKFLKGLRRNIEFAKLTRNQKLARFFKQPWRIIAYYIRNIIVRFSRATKIFFLITAETFWGGRMILKLPEPVSQEIFFHGYFEKDLSTMMIKYVKPGMTFFDVGSHFGFFTLLGEALVEKEGQVHSFDPTPETFQVLLKNCRGKRNIFPNNLAVYSETQKLEFNDFGGEFSAYNSLVGPLLEDDVAGNIKTKKIEIQAISLDEYVENKGIKPDFIKIDAECSEYEILQGAQKTIDKYQPMITVEVGDMDNEGGRSSKELLEYMTKQDYLAYEYKNGEIIPHELQDKYGYANILLIPKTKV